jgi:hypothetical protein
MADQANSERLRRLEEDVNQRVREAFGGLREQIAERLRRLSDEALDALEKLGDSAPPAVLAAADLEPLTRDAAEEAEGTAARRAGSELLAAVAAVDRARGQGEVLTALAREAARFAGRTAVLLTRSSGAELWAAEGWGDVPSSLAFSYPSAAGWSPEDLGRGAVELTGDAREELAGRLDAEPPEGALLVPLVLRDRLAAVLYADGGETSGAPVAAPLQVLVWAASQALESLPFRQRAATPTLAGLGGGEPSGEPLALWGSEGAGAAAAADDERHGHGHGAGKAVGYAAAGLAAAGLAAAGVAAVRRERAGEEEPSEGAPPEAEAAAAGESAAPSEAAPAAGSLTAFDEIVLEEGPGPEVAAPPVAFDEPAPGGEEPVAAETAAVDAGWSFDDSESLAPPEEGEAAPAADLDEPSAGEETADQTEAWGTAGRAAGFAFEEEPSGFDLDSGEATAPEDQTHPATIPMPRPDLGAAPAAESASAEAAEETYPGFATSPPAPELPAPPVAPPVAPPPAAPPAAPAAGGSAEVAPPPDLEGPGRAFAGRAEAAPNEEQARHEEARRLARLLVSEIRLYNEDEVEAGRRHGDVYERLKEDIDRSRQLYDERVDPRVREGSDYFYQELVRNLGGGDAKALGI